MEPRLEAVFLSDAVGHSRLSEAAEEGIRARLRADPHRIFEPKIAEHHGRLIRTTGDGLTVEPQLPSDDRSRRQRCE
jgi:class 3 adenylate cyclase